MSVIPPNWLSSVVGTHGAQKSAATAREKEAARQAENADGQRFAEKLHEVVETADRDGQVYADAEGLGSQGRPGGEREPPEPEAGPAAPGGGLDVQA